MNTDHDILHQLLAFHRDQLDEVQRRNLTERIRLDPDLRDMLALIVRLDGTVGVGADILSGPAHELSSRIIRDFLQKKADPGSAQGVVVFDSAVVPLPEGVRPAVVDTRQLRFKLDHADLTLALYPLTLNSFELIGQIRGCQFDGAPVVELRQGRTTLTAEADRHLLFRFPRISNGHHRLSIVYDGEKIAFVTLEV